MITTFEGFFLYYGFSPDCVSAFSSFQAILLLSYKALQGFTYLGTSMGTQEIVCFDQRELEVAGVVLNLDCTHEHKYTVIARRPGFWGLTTEQKVYYKTSDGGIL